MDEMEITRRIGIVIHYCTLTLAATMIIGFTSVLTTLIGGTAYYFTCKLIYFFSN